MVQPDISYGAIETGARRRGRASGSIWRAVRVGAAACFAAAAVLSLIAIARGPVLRSTSRTWLVQSKLKLLPTTLAGAAGHDNISSSEPLDVAFHPPTTEDVAAFADEANQILETLKVGDLDKTDLPESCGVALYPCVAKIGRCAITKIVATDDGKLTPTTSTCGCFIRGYTDPIPLPSNRDAVITCPFSCVDSILKYTDQHVVAANGHANDLSKFCSDSMDILGAQEFSNDDGYIATGVDADALDVLPADDPHALRAGRALAAHINAVRRTSCPTLDPVDPAAAEIAYARAGPAAGGRRQYKLEVRYGREVFFARLAHLPRRAQLVDPLLEAANGDSDNLEGRFAVAESTPGPCEEGEDAQLAVSLAAVHAINKQRLPWTAALRPAAEGRPARAFAAGFTPLPAAEMRRYVTSLDTAGFVPPPAFDARDMPGGRAPCQAFTILNQGSCGSCYAFAAASAYSARLCRAEAAAAAAGGDVVLSPQEVMDCVNGCGGGHPLRAYEALIRRPGVELWCDPYTQVKGTCGSHCSKGNTYTGQEGSVRTVGGAGGDGVLQMQLELLSNGPGAVGFDLYSDFSAYAGGVYVRSEGATRTGAHAVVLLGWGEEGGVPYWLLQNSWGSGWGENGFFRIRRGTNECNIEGYGLTVIRPLPPAVCPNAGCQNGAETLKDCTCKCQGGWGGERCDTCALSCRNGGAADPRCTACTCPLGLSGPECESGVTLSARAAAAGAKGLLRAVYTYGGAAPPPAQRSFIGIFPAGEAGALNATRTAMLCGAAYDPAVAGGLCPSAGAVRLVMPKAPGEYKVALVRYNPPDEFGMSGYPALLQDSDVLGLLTILPAGSSQAEVDAAAARNSPAALLQRELSAAAAAGRAQQMLVDQRLKEDAPAEAAVTQTGTLPASVYIVGLDPEKPVIWMSGPPVEVCYRVPAGSNVNPKGLVLYRADGHSYYPTAIDDAGPTKPLPATYQGCLTVAISNGIPSGPYLLRLVDLSAAAAAGGGAAAAAAAFRPIAALPFSLMQASVSFSSFELQPTLLRLKTNWSIEPAAASPTDTIQIFNSKGVVVHWFYTSCGCQSGPGESAVPAGAVDVALLRLHSVPGGYRAKLLPGGGDVIAAVDTPWINWHHIGW